jgi:hypothetical protein
MRSIAVGLESYCVDHNHYPWYNNPSLGYPGQYNAISYRLIQLTTPVAYMATVDIKDPFMVKGSQEGYWDGIFRTTYNYRNYEFFNSKAYGAINAPVWVLNSMGPDLEKNQGLLVEMWIRKLIDFEVVVLYDPTNGTLSSGDMPRTGGQTVFSGQPPK